MTKPASSTPKSFESALTELEQVVAAMEAGQMPLEESLTAYQRGMELLKYCQTTLKDAEQQVKILEGDTLAEFNPDNGGASADQ